MLKHPRPSFRSVYHKDKVSAGEVSGCTVITVIAGMWIMGLLLRDGVGDAGAAHGG